MKIKPTDISNALYKNNHDKWPRGRGSWAFGVRNVKEKRYDVVFWATDNSTVLEAKKEAAKYCTEKGITGQVYVMP